MSVLHLLGTAGDGGAETYFVDLVKALKRADVPEACVIRANAGREARLLVLFASEAHDLQTLVSAADREAGLSPGPARMVRR